MKKWIAVLISLIMVLTAAAAFAEEAVAGTPSIPRNIEEYGEEAVVSLDIFATLKTKTANGYTRITLSQPVDSLQANWMNTGEEPEELTVESDLTAGVSLAGHKLPLGASPNGEATVGDYGWIWEDYHDYYFSASDDPETVAKNIQAVIDYMNSGEFQKTEKAADFVKQYSKVKGEVQIHEPEIEFGRTVEVQGEDGETWMSWEVLATGDISMTAAERKAREDELRAMYPGEDISSYESGGYAWGILTGETTKGLVGAPNHAYITKQGSYTVIYGRDGKIKAITKDIENATFFGAGTGTAHLIYTKTNAGWRIGTVIMEYPEGSNYHVITAKYNGNGVLYAADVR